MPADHHKPRGRRLLGRGGYWLGVAALAAWSLVALLPVLAVLLSSTKDSLAILADPLGIPHSIDLSNFQRAWAGPQFGQPFWRYALNSFIAVTVGITVAMAVGTPAAYALARQPGRLAVFSRYFVLLLTIPAVLTWVPLFGLISSLHMLSNPVWLGLIYAAVVTPIVTVLMRAYFASFPMDLVEAAKVDGASETYAFVRIVLPMSGGTIRVVALLQAIMLWNELGLAVILLLDSHAQTLPVGLSMFRGQFATDYGAQYASLALAVIPIIVLYIFTQRRVTDGMRLGALK